MTNVKKRAERMVRAEQAFTRHVIEGAPLDGVAAELGVSRETIRQDVAAMQQFLGAEGTSDLDQRRAVRLAELEDARQKALALFDKFRTTKPLAAVGALNTVVSLYTHIRAIEGLDAPKEVKQEVKGDYTIRWVGEGDQ